MEIQSVFRTATLAALLVGSLPLTAPSQTVGNYQIVKAFETPTSLWSGLLKGQDGALYGIASGAQGDYPNGFLFRLAQVDGQWSRSVLHFAPDFESNAPLVQASDGTLYGRTSGRASVFRIGADGSDFTVLHEFPYLASPTSPLLLASDGQLYGVDESTLFRVSTDGSSFAVVREFAEAVTSIALTGDGDLHGTTSTGGSHGYGTLFRIRLDGSGFVVIHHFDGVMGAHPASAPIRGHDGFLYGTTPQGGPEHARPDVPAWTSDGLVYRIASDGTGFTVLHYFAGGEGRQPGAPLVQDGIGYLYGVTAEGGACAQCGTIYRLRPDGTQFSVLAPYPASEGWSRTPLAFGSDGELYGTTSTGAPGGGGLVYRLHPAGSGTEIVARFGNGDGNWPAQKLLLASDGNLYGTTYSGGVEGSGTIFRLAPDGSGFTRLSGLYRPSSALVEGAGGDLFGAAGESGLGMVFKLPPSGPVTAVHVFSDPEDQGPPSSVLVGADGALYGSGAGAVYRVLQDGTAFSLLHEFAAASEGAEGVDLVQRADGTLVGVTAFGGPWYGGTAFRLDPQGTGFAVLHAFRPGSGWTPRRGLSLSSDGTLLGSTRTESTVFRIGPAGDHSVLRRLVVQEGWGPEDGPVLSGSRLYGTTSRGGAHGDGTLFRMDLDGSRFTLLHHFEEGRGGGPGGGLVPGPDGALYGTTLKGGPLGGGVVYRILPPDELPCLSIGPGVLVQEGNSGSSVVELGVSVTPAASTGVTVAYQTTGITAMDGTDFTSTSGALTFPPAQTSGTISVAIRGDSIDEDDETFLVRLVAPSEAALCADQAVVTIQDDDPAPSLTIFDNVAVEGDGTGASAGVSVVLSHPSSRPVEVAWATHDGTAGAATDYLAGQGTLGFAPGWTFSSISVPLIGDRVPEPRETFRIELTAPSNASLLRATASLAIRDDDPKAMDFDGDGRSDIVVYRSGAWLPFDFVTGALRPGVFTGQPDGSCLPAPGDFDGDGRIDLALFCSDRWHFYDRAGTHLGAIVTGGTGSDLPVPADYDGDGRDEIVVYRDGAWLFFDRSTGSYQRGVFTGNPPSGTGAALVPYPADFDGDGSADFSIYAGGAWHFYNPDGSYAHGIWTGSVPGDLPVAGDYDGDAIDDVVVFRAGAWLWFDRVSRLLDPNRSVFTGLPPHLTGGVPLPAPLDVDGNGVLDRAVYSGGPWHFFSNWGSYWRGVWCGAVPADQPLSRRLLP